MNLTKPTLILDPSGENTVKEGFSCVATEVDLLLRDDEREPVWVRGENLCRWVASLCRNRGLREGIDYCVLDSPRDRLRALVGERVRELDPEIVRKANDLLGQDPHITIGRLLFRFTSDGHWPEPISNKHAAKYLICNFDARLEVLVDIQRQHWVEECGEAGLKRVYETPITERIDFARSWLRAGNNFGDLGVFPLQLDGEAIKLVTEEWGKLLRQTHGKALEELSVDNPNARQIAKTACQYFSQHCKSLAPSMLHRLGPLLKGSERAKLERLMPRECPQPLSPEATVKTALEWVTLQYLPYRQWQTRAMPAEESVAKELGISFSQWLLDNYPKLTTRSREESYLNIRGRYLIQELITRRVVLWVVVDGLNYLNHEHLLRLLAESEAELRVEEHYRLLAILPTITEKAKFSLTTGHFPRENEKGEWNVQGVFSEVFPDGKYAGKAQLSRLHEYLADDKTRLCYWNMTAVDECYHEQTDPDAILRNAEAQLRALSENLSDLIMKSPNRDQISVAISTDHGQMMGPCKMLHVPRGKIKAHGRTANESLLALEPGAGQAFVKDADGTIVELNPVRFQLDEPTTLALGHYCFGGWTTDSQGRAWGVHGGLYPEEVLVGFSVLNRKPRRLPVTAEIRGEGEAGRSGALQLMVDNPNRASVNLLSLRAAAIEACRDGKVLHERVEAVDTSTIEIAVQNFPSPQVGDNLQVTGVLFYEFEDGTREECEVKGAVICKQMYAGKRPSLRDRFKP
jgi:hypothetical protein